MAGLDTIARHLDRQLRLAEVPDYPGAVNGLQLRNASGRVRRVAAAVDAVLPVVEQAVAAEVDLLLVHHGMFWQGVQRIDGPVFARLKAAMDAGLAVYSAHLPLDIHPTWGNNRLLAKALGLKGPAPLLPWKGIHLGLEFRAALDLCTLVERAEKAVGGAVHVCPGGPSRTRRVGVVTGGAGGEVHAVAAAGVDTLVTGEGPHWSYTAAEELGVNVIYAGHYATETFGVRALAGHLASRFRIESLFIDHPTGL